MDGLKELVEAFSARIRSPIIGSIALAFVIVNWKPLFFLLFSGEPAVAKFAFYDAKKTGYSPYIYPMIVGLVFALFLPWINFWGAKAVEAPITKHRNLQLDAAYAEAEKKTRHAIDMETVGAAHRRALLESAKVDQEIKEANIDDDVRGELEDKLVETKGAEHVETIDMGKVQKPLSAASLVLLTRAAENPSGRFSFKDAGGTYYMVFGSFKVLTGGHIRPDPKDGISQKQYVLANEVVENLVRDGYMNESNKN